MLARHNKYSVTLSSHKAMLSLTNPLASYS